MRRKISLHSDAVTDLEHLKSVSPQIADEVLVFFETIEADDSLLDTLTTHGHRQHGTQDFNVKKWQEHWRKGLDIWRLRLFWLEPLGFNYRVVYALDQKVFRFHILAILPRREINYDDSSDVNTRRILKAYPEL